MRDAGPRQHQPFTPRKGRASARYQPRSTPGRSPTSHELEELGHPDRALTSDTEGQATGAGDWAACFVPAPDVSASVLEGEAVLVNRDTGGQYTLNPVATAVWELLDGHRPLAAVLGALAEEFDAPEARLRGDLLALIDQFRAEGLIEIHR